MPRTSAAAVERRVDLLEREVPPSEQLDPGAAALSSKRIDERLERPGHEAFRYGEARAVRCDGSDATVVDPRMEERTASIGRLARARPPLSGARGVLVAAKAVVLARSQCEMNH